MKKFLALALAALMIFACPISAFAGGTLLKSDEVTLDADPTSMSQIFETKNFKEVSFLVDYNETDTGTTISAAVTTTCSYDGTNFQSCNFFDIAGGATSQSSETLSADGRYLLWFSTQTIPPYLKVVVTATGSDASNYAVVRIYGLGRE